jgi:hypothetical protein
VKTYTYQIVTLTSYTGGKVISGNVSSPFGPLRAGLITTQPTRNQQLEALLSFLEREVEILESKYFTVLNTSLLDTTHLVSPIGSTSDTTGTK